MLSHHSEHIPGLARLGGELYLKSHHPFKYAQILLESLNEHLDDFTDPIQIGLGYFDEFLHEVEHYRFDVAQSGFREYLNFKRRDILQDVRLDSAERQEIISLMYNIAFLNDHLETLHRVVRENQRDDLMREILRPTDKD